MDDEQDTNRLLQRSSDTVRPAIDGSGAEIDENNGNHVNVGLFLRPDEVPGPQIGGAFCHDNISDFSLGPNVRLGQSVLNAHAVYTGHHFEILNEGFLIRHSYEGGGSVFNMPVFYFYSQWSKAFGHIRPFFRYQYVNVNPNSILRDASLRHGPSFGARSDFNDNIAFKLQLDHTLRRGKPDLNGLQTQLAFTF